MSDLPQITYGGNCAMSVWGDGAPSGCPWIFLEFDVVAEPFYVDDELVGYDFPSTPMCILCGAEPPIRSPSPDG